MALEQPRTVRPATGLRTWHAGLSIRTTTKGFFVRRACFRGGKAPYRALQTTPKAEIDDKNTWATLKRAIARPFDKPETGRIVVKVINHLVDGVMKVLNVS